MPVSRVKTWNALDILTASDLNGEFNAVMNNCVSLTGSETLTNKTIASPALSGTATGTYTLGGTPTITSPTINTPTINTPTITSPTITGPKVTTGSYVDKGDSGTGTITCDLTEGNIQRVRATGNFTLAFSNPGSGQRFLIIIQQDGTGSRTVTWPNTIRWLNGTGATDSTTDKPTLTTTADKQDVFSFTYISALSLYLGSVVGYKGAIA